MLDRRTFLASSAAAGLAAPGWAATSADAALDALLQRHAELFLRRCPEEATGQQLDVGANAVLRSRLTDRSLAAMAADRTAIAEARRQLGAIGRAGLSPRAALDHDVASFVYDRLADLTSYTGFVDIDLRPSPYVVNQMNGAYYWLPGFIGSNHPLANAADVDAWYARLTALGIAIDQETDRIRHDAAAGVAPPGFVLERTIAQVRALRDTPPLTSALIAPAVVRAHAAGLGDIGGRGADIFRATIAPALDRQAQALEALLPNASTIAGVWRLPNGDAYYAATTYSNTTVATPPAELHRQGLAQVAELTAQIDAGLKAQGLSKGSVRERMAALDHDPRFLVSDDDAGRARLLAEADRELKDIIARLPRAFNDPPNDPIVVAPVAAAQQNGSPIAFYHDGVGDAPGTYMLNLKDPRDIVLWRLPTLTHHEGIPGHHFQFSMLRHARQLPLFRRIVRFSAYTEGYGLYAQQVADEIGAFEGDPFGRLGYLQSELFRAARIVVDTGIHHLRWTREQGVQWMVEHGGELPGPTDREVVRYCVYPGQACSFKVGANAIVAAREAARKRLGSRFDVRAYHDLVLRSGPMPMSVLEAAAARM
ncbi:DUF885 domain-containing protein [Sphingomonas nostoxanthinifaciens]|uniref:DUF885 domain-containing protein n=1 Tax=Sphingomonas nostoxanthinifaciens TaxID=2872652 RepID=UPI001CC1F562|nr:DUF885 family protein [Sphingomonas nostoxanthinifaciens]